MKFLSAIVLSLVLIGFSFSKTEPIKITWDDLADVEFVEVYIDSLESWFWLPSYSEEIKSLNGKQIEISGFYSNLDSNLQVLSKRHMSNLSCSASINNSPVELMNLNFSREESLDLASEISVRGLLELNFDDIYELSYNLENAVLID